MPEQPGDRKDSRQNHAGMTAWLARGNVNVDEDWAEQRGPRIEHQGSSIKDQASRICPGGACLPEADVHRRRMSLRLKPSTATSNGLKPVGSWVHHCPRHKCRGNA